ncbi:transaldolase family protein [Elioraea sp.]|uniref:transaldolase family protein n=1 Tax=Elioraea sp. TaxID=2185103 RepID=UPI003F727DAB
MGETRAALASCGRQLAALAPGQVVVKLAATQTGLEAWSALRSEGVRATITAVDTPAQAPAALGAAYAGPCFGRLSDAGQDAVAVVPAMRAILRNAGDRTRLLLASLRRVEDVTITSRSARRLRGRSCVARNQRPRHRCSRPMRVPALPRRAADLPSSARGAPAGRLGDRARPHQPGPPSCRDRSRAAATTTSFNPAKVRGV